MGILRDFDGIIYPSVQRGSGTPEVDGENVVLFNKASMTMSADRESATAITDLWNYDDDEYCDGPYRETPLRPTILFNDLPPYPALQRQFNQRSTPTLQLIHDGIVIHQVKAVEIKALPIEVKLLKK